MINQEKFKNIANKIKQYDQNASCLGYSVTDDKYLLGFDGDMNEIYVIEISESGRIRNFDSDGDDIDDLIDFLGQRFPKIFDGVNND